MPYQGETQLIKSRSKSLTLYSLHHLTKCREILEKWNSMNRTGRNIELQALEWWGMHVSYRLYNLLYRHESEAAFLILSSCFILTTNSRHWAYLTALELLRGTSAIANRRRGEVCVCGGGGGGGGAGGGGGEGGDEIWPTLPICTSAPDRILVSTTCTANVFVTPDRLRLQI